MIHVFVRICYTTHVPGKSPVISSTSTVSWERQLAVCLFSFQLGGWLLLPTSFSTVHLIFFSLRMQLQVPDFKHQVWWQSKRFWDFETLAELCVFLTVSDIFHIVYLSFLIFIYLNGKSLIRTIFNSKGNAFNSNLQVHSSFKYMHSFNTHMLSSY